MTKGRMLLLTVAVSALTLGCAADDAGEPAPVDTAAAVPGMDGDTQPTQGTGATEPPDQ
jgi:hypothetical protein